MKKRMSVSVVVIWVLGQLLAIADPPSLRELDWKRRDDLKGVTSVTVSPDGKHLYAAAFKSGDVVGFDRDAKTGKLKYLQTLTSPEAEPLGSAVSIRMSKDGKRAVVASFGTSTVTLLARDVDTGKLSILDHFGEMNFVIDASLSPDGKHIYAGCMSSVTVLSVSAEGKLDLVQTNSGEDTPIQNSRCVKVSDDGKNVYATSRTGELLGYQRDAKTGELTQKQRIGNGHGGADGPAAIDGIHFIALSPDGKHLYTVSGRFGGTDGVSVFARDKDGALTFIQERISDTEGGPTNFAGGNEVAVSPDGTLVYAVASLSDSLARFGRDPETGKLTFLQTVPVGEKAAPGSAGVTFSPDGKNCYVADEDASAVWAYGHKVKK